MKRTHIAPARPYPSRSPLRYPAWVQRCKRHRVALREFGLILALGWALAWVFGR